MNNTLGTFDVVIVGAGFSGLLCAGYLREAGVANIQIFEMASLVAMNTATQYFGANQLDEWLTVLPMRDHGGGF